MTTRDDVLSTLDAYVSEQTAKQSASDAAVLQALKDADAKALSDLKNADSATLATLQKAFDDYKAAHPDTTTPPPPPPPTGVLIGIKWYGTRHHEPENDIPGTISLAQWKQYQATDMPKVRAAGGIPTVILMGFTMAPTSGRNPADYTLPKGLVDVYGIDFYPDKSPNRTQAQIIGAFKAMLPTWGVTRWAIAEYGVIGTSQAAGKPNYAFTSATSTAWFG
jgi:hypothetical protein